MWLRCFTVCMLKFWCDIITVTWTLQEINLDAQRVHLVPRRSASGAVQRFFILMSDVSFHTKSYGCCRRRRAFTQPAVTGFKRLIFSSLQTQPTVWLVGFHEKQNWLGWQSFLFWITSMNKRLLWQSVSNT